MKKNLMTLIFIMFSLISCGSIRNDTYYRIKKISSKCKLQYLGEQSRIYCDSKSFFAHLWYENSEEINGTIVVGMEFSKTEKQKKSKIKLLDKVKIIKNGRIFIISKIDTEVYEDNGIKRTYFTLYLPEKLTGKITLDFGKVDTGDGEFKVPLMYLQRYKVTESNTLMEALLNEGGENIKFYHNEGWIEE